MTDTRKFWLDTMLRIADPVLNALSRRTLRRDMPIYHHPQSPDRADYTYLETLGRLLFGMAPWLETPAEDADEETLRQKYAALVREAIKAGVDPASPDVMNFAKGYQPIVDAAFLAQALLRAPTELYDKLDDGVKAHLIARMKETRTRKPHANNWLLFAAIIEAFLYKAGEADWDPMRIDYALKQHMQWYKGDGIYGDGAEFHFDYYNSFVIQPMLCDIVNAVRGIYKDWDNMAEKIFLRAARYATELELLISPEGTYPVIGRSTAYRFGAFQSLSQAVLLAMPAFTLPPAQVRCALTAVIARVMEHPSVFDENGWMQIGVCGAQPRMGDTYISTGSLYLCSAVFLPLGLTESHPFWADPDLPWSQKRIWAGEDTLVDHALLKA